MRGNCPKLHTLGNTWRGPGRVPDQFALVMTKVRDEPRRKEEDKRKTEAVADCLHDQSIATRSFNLAALQRVTGAQSGNPELTATAARPRGMMCGRGLAPATSPSDRSVRANLAFENAIKASRARLRASIRLLLVHRRAGLRFFLGVHGEAHGRNLSIRRNHQLILPYNLAAFF